MQLNELQLEIMQLGADKSLSFGCIVYDYSSVGYDFVIQVYDDTIDRINKIMISGGYIKNDYEIIGHPIRYDRLCYLKRTDKKPEVIIDGIKSKMEKWINVCFAFESNPELYNQSILEWSDEVLNLVRDFLLSIQ